MKSSVARIPNLNLCAGEVETGSSGDRVTEPLGDLRLVNCDLRSDWFQHVGEGAARLNGWGWFLLNYAPSASKANWQSVIGRQAELAGGSCSARLALQPCGFSIAPCSERRGQNPRRWESRLELGLAAYG